MKSKIKELYYESRASRDDQQEVTVVLCKLEAPTHLSWRSFHGEYMMKCSVMVDGEVQVDDKRFLKAWTDSQAIRQAIVEFDGQLAAHPILGKEMQS